ncbi:MAG: serine/threonine protein kinase [Planctomycetota bacterium]|nr:serine/threonine protein kinase [Planctomycetota bacterium]
MSGENLVFGPYLLKRRLGRGATGTVWHAFDTQNNIPVALKFLSSRFIDNEDVLTMFEEEAKAGMQISHENVVKTLEVGRIDGRPYIAFELVVGQSLQELIERGPLKESQCIWVLRHMGQALRELRRKGVVHQDIKPDNILVENTGNCKLVDLGFARQAEGRIDWEGVAAGTAYYMSPEQCRAEPGVAIDSRSDVYSLGATIYHAATGVPPFKDDNEDVVLDMHIHAPLVPANRRNQKLSSDFAKILSMALQKNLAMRYQSPEELLLDLRNVGTKAEPPIVIGARFKPE